MSTDFDPNNKIFMVGTDGGKKIVPTYLKEEMIKKGWKVLINPPKGIDYFPELDQTSPFYNKNKQVDFEEHDILEVEVIQ